MSRRGSQTARHHARSTAARARANLRRSIDRWAERTSARASGKRSIGLIGLDVSRPPVRLRTHSWMPIVAAAVVGAMFLTVLRMDVIRMRFTLAHSFKEELLLEELKRERTVEMRQLRDPSVLARSAKRLGFRRAERLIDLDPLAAPPVLVPISDPADSIELAAVSPRQRMLRP